MKRRWIRRIGVAALFLAGFVGAFSLGLNHFFPSGTVRRWITSLNVSENLSVASVRETPLFQVEARGVAWKPPKNPVFSSVFVPILRLRPSWRELLRGHRALTAVAVLGDGRITGTMVFAGSVFRVSLTSSGSLPFPGPFRFHKGISLDGTWTLKADLSRDMRKSRGGVSGDIFFLAKALRLRWPESPLGALNLSFTSGTMKGTFGRSVLVLRTIEAKGRDLNITGNATLWLDLFTGRMQGRGTLYFQPLMDLANTNPKLNAAIQYLPREAGGYRLSF